MIFFTSIYGNEYVPFLTTFLFSIVKHYPENRIVVYWDDIDEIELNLIKHNFKKVDFRRVKLDTHDQALQVRIPMKMKHWMNFLETEADGKICLLDIDIVCYRKIDEYVNRNFDILFTGKEERFPINTGVMIVNNSNKVRSFYRTWFEEIELTLKDSTLSANAIEQYGAVDQAVFANKIGKFELDHEFEIEYANTKLKILPIGCEILNETRSVSVNSGASLFHYKGGWHPILLRKQRFSKGRPETTSLEMKVFWENIHNRANEEILSNFIMSSVHKHRNVLDWSNEEYLERGIIHSEMLTVISLVKELKIDLIIESGRCKGQSTKVLSMALENDEVLIESIELCRDENAAIAEEKLSNAKNVILHYGDSNDIIERIVESNKSKKIALLIDGPKGEEALKLVRSIIHEKNIKIVFVHDMNLYQNGVITKSRYLFNRFFNRTFFTDEDAFIKSISELDGNCVAPKHEVSWDSWRPHYKGWDYIHSYGSTCGIVIPNYIDRNESSKSRLMSKQKKAYARVIKKVLKRIIRR